MKSVDDMIAGYTEEDKIDVLICPELCFTGYFFKDREDVKEVLEFKDEGKTLDWCRKHAKRLGSYVFASYPEKVSIYR